MNAIADTKGSPANHGPIEEYLEKLRDRGNIYYSSKFGAWLVTSYTLVEQLLRDRRLSITSSTSFSERSPEFRSSFVKALRDFLSKPEANGIAEIVDLSVNETLSKLLASPTAELVEQLAREVPLAVMCDLLGIPRSDRRKLLPLMSNQLLDYDLTSGGTSKAGVLNTVFLNTYFLRHIRRVRSTPQPPLLAFISKQEHALILSDEVIADIGAKLLISGTTTTSGLLANILLRVLCTPLGQLLQRASNTQLNKAVDEFVRLDSPVLGVKRRANQTFKIEDTVITKGEMVVLLTAAANRDPAYFPRPADFDLERAGKAQLSFGKGPFYCLGQPLALLEARTMLNCFLPHLQSFEVSEPPLHRPACLLNEVEKLFVEIRRPIHADRG